MDGVGRAGALQIQATQVDAAQLNAVDDAPPADAARDAPAPTQVLAPGSLRQASGGFAVAALLSRLEPEEAAPRATVRVGSRGPDVEALQEALNADRAGRGLAPIALDGIFGPETKAALQAFQSVRGLDSDGVAGPLTWNAIGDAPRVPGPSPAPTPGPTPTPSPAPAPAPAPAPRPGPAPATPPRPSDLVPSGPAGPETFPAGTQPLPKGAEARRQEAAWTRAGMPGKISVSDMASNGGRPAAVYVPQGLDPSKPVRVMTYFHGHNGNVGEALATRGTLAHLKELEKQHPNTVFVMPQAADHPFSYWMKPPKESYDQLMKDALGEAARMAGVPSLTVGERVVAAHSGGGLALKNVVAAGQMKADKLELLDCTYGSWGQDVARWAMRQPEGRRPRIESWVTPGDTTKNDAEIEKIAGPIFQSHRSPVGHSDIPAKLLGATF